MAPRTARQPGFTLVEVLITVAILALLGGIAMPLYQGYLEEAELHEAIEGIRTIELLVDDFAMTNRVHPDSLADVGADGMLDPWGRPYQYLNIADGGNEVKGKARKDKFLVPVNSDYDLYSLGKDGDSKAPFAPKVSHDDVVRANDGAYVGLAKSY